MKVVVLKLSGSAILKEQVALKGSERSCVRYCDVHLVSSSLDCLQHVSVGAMLSIRPSVAAHC